MNEFINSDLSNFCIFKHITGETQLAELIKLNQDT